VGGHLKNTVAISVDSSVIITPHIGDLDNALSVAVHRRAIEDLVDFFGVTPAAIACDLHPDYASTRSARELAARWQIPRIPVQHHHAHIAACVAERRIPLPVLGFSWDGTGYGPDGTVWGGEMLLSGGGRYERVAHLRTFLLPGGDRAAREPRRAALGLLFEMVGASAADRAHDWFTTDELRVLLAAARRPRLFPRTSSMGRLFDAVAAICGLFPRCSFEGQAAMALEYAVDPAVEDAYPLPLRQGAPAVGDWEPLIHAVLADRRQGVPLARIAARFHNALADLAVAVAQRVDCPRVVLTGGCFQNTWLTERVRDRLSGRGFAVYTHRQVPPGDGGIALGQVVVAAENMKEHADVSGDSG
jgi:hydrogenase maturation protein HypF